MNEATASKKKKTKKRSRRGEEGEGGGGEEERDWSAACILQKNVANGSEREEQANQLEQTKAKVKASAMT